MFALGFLLLSPGIKLYTHPLEKIKTNISHVIIQYVRKTWVGAFDHEAVHVSSGETSCEQYGNQDSHGRNLNLKNVNLFGQYLKRKKMIYEIYYVYFYLFFFLDVNV